MYFNIKMTRYEIVNYLIFNGGLYYECDLFSRHLKKNTYNF